MPPFWSLQVAAALASRHVGGAINFVAVSETLGIQGSTVSSAIAADNVVVALYFVFLFSSAKGRSFNKRGNVAGKVGEVSKGLERNRATDLESISVSLSISALIVWAGGILTNLLLPPGVSKLPMLSVLAIACSTAFPKFFGSFRGVGNILGVLFIQMFFAASGAAGDLVEVLKNAPSLFAFSLIQIALHWSLLMLVGKRMLKLNSRDLYVASNANVGGPTTAAAMAQGKGWDELVLPGLLVGIAGEFFV